MRPSVFFRGMAMGAADVVPGVSGGTLALIMGIYEELIATLGGITPRLISVWRESGFRAVWQQANLTFLVTLLAGIVSSIALLARLISWLLVAYPVPLWAFFSGLIFASIFLVGAPLRKHWPQLVAFVIGTAIAVLIAFAPHQLVENVGPVTLFFSGMLAICAMILPGISGSFILLLLGMYQPLLLAIKEGQWLLICAFMAGCAVGLLSFVHVLKWLLQRFHDTLMALLVGFMAGSLVKLWPWRVAAENGTELHALPAQYAVLTGLPAQTGWACVLACVGLVTVWLLHRASPVHNDGARGN